MNLLDQTDEKAWSDFIFNHPHGNIFQTPEMNGVYKQTKNYEPISILVGNKKSKILGTLLAVIQKEHSGLLGYLSARSIIFGGPIIKNNDRDILDFVLKEYKKKIKGKAIYSQFRNSWDWSKEEKDIFIKNGFIFEDHQDIIIDLNKSEEDLWTKFSRDRKKSIKKSQTFLQIKLIEIDQDFDTIYTLLKQVYDRIRLPLPSRSFFYNAICSLRKTNSIKIFGAFKESTLVGVRLVLCYKGMIYDWYAGSDDGNLKYRPNDILPWAVLKWGIENKYEVFDFGGAGKPDVQYGVRDYKLKFGGELVNFGRFEMTHKSLFMYIGKLSLKLYRFLKL